MTMFRCERFHCTMSLDACRKRRKSSSKGALKWTQTLGASCKGCEQWRKVKGK